MTKIVELGAGSVSGSVSERYGSADLDPYQNVMDPQIYYFLKLTEIKDVYTPYEHPWYSSTNDFNKKPDLLSKFKVLTKNIDIDNGENK
jgi:hypothetical protein